MSKYRKIAAFILSLVFLLPAWGCDNGGYEPKEGRIAIQIYAAGYGTAWIDEAVKLYKAENPGIEFKIEQSPLAFESIKTQLENGNCKDDIVLLSTTYYEQFVERGLLEDLTDVYETEIPGSDKKVKDVVSSQIAEARTMDGKLYGVPWQQNTPVGLAYNKKMFAKYGWDENMPTTMDEFWGLCDQIATDTEGQVAPFTYGGANSGGYMSFNFPQWLCEYYGYDAMLEFLQLESPAAYSSQSAGRAKIFETIAKLTRSKTSYGTNIALEGSEGATAITAQSNFVNGKAAMLTCGPWFPTEMAEYIALRNFDVGYLPMPHINADKRSGDGTLDTSKVRFSTDGNLIAIPSTSINKEIAKDFLVHMFTEKSYTSFVKANNGLIRPISGIDADTSTFNGYTKQVYEYLSASGEAQTVYQVSRDMLIEKGTMAIFLAYKGSFFGEIVGKATYDAALTAAKGAVADEMVQVNQRWDSAKQEWKR